MLALVMVRFVRGLAVVGAALLAFAALTRPWMMRWGATGNEVRAHLPGDELVADPNLTATRAITVEAPVEDVWPWIAQLGQGRGGFYSYSDLENLAGGDIHNADRIVPGWQSVGVGSAVRLGPEFPLTVAVAQPPRALVLHGGIPLGRTPPLDFTWAFVLGEGRVRTTRLVVRERYVYLRWWAAVIAEPASLVSFVMSRRMLYGIKERAERAAGVAYSASERAPSTDCRPSGCRTPPPPPSSSRHR